VNKHIDIYSGELIYPIFSMY